MELRRNEPDFLLSVVQMIRSLKRNRERSFFPPTVFCRAQGDGQIAEKGRHIGRDWLKLDFAVTSALQKIFQNQPTVVGLISTSYRLHDHFLSYELPLGIQNLKK